MDWIEARARCDLKEVFSALRQQMEKDVARFNGLPDRLRAYRTFKVSDLHPAHPQYSVTRTAPLTPGQAEILIGNCYIQTDSIIILDFHGKELRITCQWDAEHGQCLVKWDGKLGPVDELGKVTRTVLEPVFFKPV